MAESPTGFQYQQPSARKFSNQLLQRASTLQTLLQLIKKDYQNTQTCITQLESSSEMTNNDLVSHMLEAINKMEQNFQKQVSGDVKQNKYFQKQMQLINQDAIQLHHSLQILDSKVTNAEYHVGTHMTLTGVEEDDF